MLCVPSVAWLVHTTIPPPNSQRGVRTRDQLFRDQLPRDQLLQYQLLMKHVHAHTWPPLLIAPFPSLELVGDVLQQPGELNGILLEHISTETSQSWLGKNQTLV